MDRWYECGRPYPSDDIYGRRPTEANRFLVAGHILSSQETSLIPTVLAIGFVGGLWNPKRGVWVVAAATLFWITLVLVAGDIDSPGATMGAAALGGANAAVGFGLGRLSRSAVERLFRSG